VTATETDRRIADYPYRRIFPTRWNDNDQYGHVNNVVYYEAMDTTINAWLVGVAGLDPLGGQAIGVCVASGCEYRQSIAYPDDMEVGLSAARIGRTSVTWALGIFRHSDGAPLAAGTFTHVFVEADTRRPTPIPPPLRELIDEQLLADSPRPGSDAGKERQR
jgi:acyl-CoA thioester hydrolase